MYVKSNCNSDCDLIFANTPLMHTSCLCFFVIKVRHFVLFIILAMSDSAFPYFLLSRNVSLVIDRASLGEGVLLVS